MTAHAGEAGLRPVTLPQSRGSVPRMCVIESNLPLQRTLGKYTLSAAHQTGATLSQ